MARVIVVGGGLAGLSAAHTILERGGRVLVLDKNPFLGGNSTKATSGINGAGTATQRAHGIEDSVELFYEDTAHGARELIRPPLVKVLTSHSGPAVEWLQSAFGLDLSLVSRLGGHSQPRTHRGKERFPGMTITYALMEKLEEIAASNPDLAAVVTKARVVRLITGADGSVTGVEYECGGQRYTEYGPVVLATGGYAADFTADGIIARVRPDLIARNLATTNGEHCTGDGIRLAESVGGGTVDLESVQVHPTGLVDPAEPECKVKFLAAEALRGEGGLLLDRNGKRFCNELGHRDYVTGEMWKNEGPFRLVLNSEAASNIGWHCKHYEGRGLMKKVNSGAELAAEMGISPDALAETFDHYNSHASPETDPWGKKFFPALPLRMDDSFYVAVVTPVFHYTMGGLEINERAEVANNGRPIPKLFAAGEVCGGVHGANRLGGSSLLDCVVFGRVAGASAAASLLASALEGGAGAAGGATVVRNTAGGPTTVSQSGDGFTIGTTVSQPGVTTSVSIKPHGRRLSLEVSWSDDEGAGVCPAGPAAPAGSSSSGGAGGAAPSGGSHAPSVAREFREYTAAEVAEHNTADDCWVIVNGQVLDVTNFLKDHPGGAKAIMMYAGRDATTEFNMLHKPDVVDKYAPECVIGTLAAGSSGDGAGSKKKDPATFDTGCVPSETESWNSGGTAGILPAERAKASFDYIKLMNFLDGGAEGTERRRFIIGPTENYDSSNKHNLSRTDILKEHLDVFLGTHSAFWGKIMPTRQDIEWMSEHSTMSGGLMNHYGLFLPTLLSQTSPQQKAWWLMKALKCEIVGCYAQTELGHGSNVRGLQTTATYDKATQEFVICTPTLKSMKWWPGALGKFSTHAIVYAQLIIEGKEYGVHAFMMQIRDENHKPLPGIEVGDVGPKLGDAANDTGFMRIDNVRIPREFMLAEFQQVTPEGEYVLSEKKKKNDKLHYATMMFTRGMMVCSSGAYLARAATVATRYSCVRTQGFKQTKGKVSYTTEERQIIDHTVQRYRVLRQLAMSYAIKFTGLWMIDKFKELEGEASASSSNLANINALPEIASTSAGLKALCTYNASQGIEDCRKCCGGHGYLLASGVGALATDYVWQTTAEGDFLILMLQTARSLMKSYKKALAGEPLSGPVDYMLPLKQRGFDYNAAPCPEARSKDDFKDLGFLIEVFKHRALVRVAAAGAKLHSGLAADGSNYDDAWNAAAIELVSSVKAHCYLFLLRTFADKLGQCEDAAVRAVLERVCALYATSNILDEASWVGILSSRAVGYVHEAVDDLLTAIRPDSVALVDAFDFRDNVLNSVIGRHDGNVYEALYESAVKSELNQVDPFDGYEEYLRPYLDLEFLQNGNNVPGQARL